MDIDALIAEVREAKKYRGIDEATIARICREEAAKHARPEDAAKAAKRKLHQIAGAFLGGAARWLEAPAEELLRAHASTRERIAFAEAFYADIESCAGVPGRVLDLACGLHPLQYLGCRAAGGLPMPAYAAYDIHREALEIVRRFFVSFGIDGLARPLDLLCDMPDTEADLAFLLKIAPLLERQCAGSFERVLAGVRARFVAVSFPTRSLGGARFGMATQYRRFFSECLARGGHRLLLEKAYPNELLFVVKKA